MKGESRVVEENTPQGVTTDDNARPHDGEGRNEDTQRHGIRHEENEGKDRRASKVLSHLGLYVQSELLPPANEVAAW